MSFLKTVFTASLLFASHSLCAVKYAGVNEAGGEFGSSVLPGKQGTDYDFINPSTVDTFATKNNINVFRVGFLLERMCPKATGLGKTFDETYFKQYADAINHITVTNKKYAIINPHNYMRYGDPSNQPTSGPVIGSSDSGAATTQAFQDFWQELAGRFKGNDYVIFGIMNEPHDMDTALIVKNDNAAIAGIRASGSKNLILAPGNGYTGGHSWTEKTGDKQYEPNSDHFNDLTDPISNTAIDIHEYLDDGFGGSKQACTQPGPERLSELTSWLQTNKKKAFVSETGGANNADCDKYLTDILTYLNKTPEYIGWAMWAAGPMWKAAPACCGADAGGTKQQIGSLEPGTSPADGGPGLYETVWQKVVQPLVPGPSALKQSGVSSL